MAFTILIAKVLGTYLVIGGVAVIARKRFFMSVVGSFVEEKAARLLLAVIDIIAALFILNLQTDWSTLPAMLITALMWITLAKGLVAMFIKDADLEKFTKSFHEKKWYVPEALVVVVIGLYLAAYGFGWF